MNGKGLYGLLPFNDILCDSRTKWYDHGWYIIQDNIMHIWSTRDEIIIPKGTGYEVNYANYITHGMKPYICSLKPHNEPLVSYARVLVIPKSKPTSAEIAQAWINFKPVVPLAYVVAARKAARNR